MCANKFPTLYCRPVAAQFMEENLIALFAFEVSDNGVSICDEKHYRLVPPDLLTDEDLTNYRNRTLSPA